MERGRKSCAKETYQSWYCMQKYASTMTHLSPFCSRSSLYLGSPSSSHVIAPLVIAPLPSQYFVVQCREQSTTMWSPFL